MDISNGFSLLKTVVLSVCGLANAGVRKLFFFSETGQMVNYFWLCGQTIFVTITQLCCYSTEAVIDNTK